MRKSLWVLALAVVAAACGDKEKAAGSGTETEGKIPFEIQGKVKHTPYIYLKEITDNGARTLDSTRPNPDGSFIFSGRVKEPNFYLLDFYGLQQAVVVLDSVPVQVTADGDRADGNLQVLGSENNRWFQKVENLRDTYMAQMQAIMGVGRGTNDPATQQAQANMTMRLRSQAKRLIDSMGYSPVALYATNFLNVNEDFPFLDSLSKRFKMHNPNSQLVQEFAHRLDQRSAVGVGVKAPALAGPGPKGESVSLEQLKGQVVLVDFWASWCGPCRRQNPEIVSLYKKYKDQGFTVLGVSLDEDKDKWVAAIEKDGLTWPHMSELKKWNSELARRWQVNEIPTNFLIDRDGTIVGRSLEGPELQAVLEDMLKK